MIVQGFGYAEHMTKESSAHKFGGDPLAEYVYFHMDRLADNASGEAESSTGWFAKAGSKRIIRGDNYGFVWLERFANPNERDQAFAQLEEAYALWEGESDN